MVACFSRVTMAQLAGTDLAYQFSSVTGDVILKMMKAGILALCVCAAPRVVAAQTMQWADKGYASVNFGYQAGSHDLETHATFPLYDEQATDSTTQKVGGGAFFDIGGAYKTWRNNVLLAVAFSHMGSDPTVDMTLSIPAPGVTDQPRNVTSSQSGANHSENVLHIDAVWMMPVANKLDIGFFGGPSIFFVKQDTVTNLTVTETSDPAHPSVSAPLEEVSKTTVGLNFGLDVQYLIDKRWGVGGLARYSWASVDIPGATKT